MTPFDFVNSINYEKKDLFEDPQAEKDYKSFIVNKALSYFPDTVLYANAMNVHNQIPVKWQFDFLSSTITKKRRYSKWIKKDVTSESLTAVSTFYKYSTEKALEALSILSNEQINVIKQQMDKGGKQ